MKKLSPSNIILDPTPGLTLSQINDTYHLLDNIIDSLDDFALKELTSGDIGGVDNLLEVLLQEATSVLYQHSSSINTAKFGYIDHLTSSVDEALRINNFNYFVLSTMPQFELNPHNLEWGNLVQLYRLLCIIAARDHSKSHTFSMAYPIWKMYRYQKPTASQPRVRKELVLSREGMLITNEHSLGKKLLKKIKDQIEDSPILMERLKPDSRKEGWGKEELNCKNGSYLSLKSFGSTMRGPHPDWIVVDDFLDKSCLYSVEQRNKFIEVFNAEIMNMIVPDGQVVCVGTPFHAEDLYGNLKKSNKWMVLEYPAIFPDGTLLMPSRHSLSSILDKQSQGSIIFSREILVKPVSSGSTIFPYEMVSKCFTDRFSLVNSGYKMPTKFVRVVCGVDIARSANVGADYSVFTTLGIDEHDRYWILNLWREKGKRLGEQIAKLKQLHATFNYDIIIIEANQMQQLFVDSAEDSNLPVKGHTTGINKYDLDKGLPSLALLFEQERILMPRGDQFSIDTTDMLAMELASMTWTEKGKLQGAGANDDTVMSLLMAVIAAREGTGFGAMWL